MSLMSPDIGLSINLYLKKCCFCIIIPDPNDQSQPVISLFLVYNCRPQNCVPEVQYILSYSAGWQYFTFIQVLTQAGNIQILQYPFWKNHGLRPTTL